MSDFVPASQVFLDNPATTVDEALQFIAAKGVELGISDSVDDLLAAFKAREAEGTTGMQGGFAIPHAKSSSVNKAAVIVVKFANEIDWQALDGSPVKVAIALLVPDGEAGTTHLKLLSKVAMMLVDASFCENVLASSDAAQIAGLINAGLDD